MPSLSQSISASSIEWVVRMMDLGAVACVRGRGEGGGSHVTPLSNTGWLADTPRQPIAAPCCKNARRLAASRRAGDPVQQAAHLLALDDLTTSHRFLREAGSSPVEGSSR
jgi:hypothetical protein